jgi:hypothetical protein
MVSRLFLLIAWLWIVGISAAGSSAARAADIVLPKMTDHAERSNYPSELLAFILDKADYKYTFKLTKSLYTQSRIAESLKLGRVDIFWMGTSKEYESSLYAIPFPLYRGLLGYRIFVIHRDNQFEFDRVSGLADLRQYTGIQGIGWSDVEVLQHSGLHQEQAVYDNIFAMIHMGRADYFPLGFQEAYVRMEARLPELPHLSIEERILLVYPFAMFFFTNPENIELITAIELGFERAYEDGSMLEFFYKHPDINTAIQRARLDQRLRIDIPNPMLSERTLSIPKEYWHQ